MFSIPAIIRLTTLTFRALHGNHIVSTPLKQSWKKIHKKSSPTCSSTPWPSMKQITLSLLPAIPNTIQYLIPGTTTYVELLKQVRIWQSPSRDPWSNCLINSRETTKGQTNYYSGRQKDNSKTICFRAGYRRLHFGAVYSRPCLGRASTCKKPVGLTLSTGCTALLVAASGDNPVDECPWDHWRVKRLSSHCCQRRSPWASFEPRNATHSTHRRLVFLGKGVGEGTKWRPAVHAVSTADFACSCNSFSVFQDLHIKLCRDELWLPRPAPTPLPREFGERAALAWQMPTGGVLVVTPCGWRRVLSGEEGGVGGVGSKLRLSTGLFYAHAVAQTFGRGQLCLSARLPVQFSDDARTRWVSCKSTTWDGQPILPPAPGSLSSEIWASRLGRAWLQPGACRPHEVLPRLSVETGGTLKHSSSSDGEGLLTSERRDTQSPWTDFLAQNRIETRILRSTTPCSSTMCRSAKERPRSRIVRALESPNGAWSKTLSLVFIWSAKYSNTEPDASRRSAPVPLAESLRSLPVAGGPAATHVWLLLTASTTYRAQRAQGAWWCRRWARRVDRLAVANGTVESATPSSPEILATPAATLPPSEETDPRDDAGLWCVPDWWSYLDDAAVPPRDGPNPQQRRSSVRITKARAKDLILVVRARTTDRLRKFVPYLRRHGRWLGPPDSIL